jgi:4-hydroxybenzoate polyprenyltransferase
MKALDYFFASRPMLLIPVWSVYLVSLEYHHRLSGEAFSLIDLAIMGLLTLAFAGAYYINQVYDEQSDRLNEKVGFLQKGLVSPIGLSAGFCAVSVAALGAAAVVSLPTLAVLGQIVLLGWLYSAPPVRMKDRPFWGMFANAWAVGLLVSCAVMPDISVHTAGLLGWDNPFYFLTAVASITLVTTIADRTGDAATGKRTLAVVIGPRPTLLVACFLMALACWIAFKSGHAELFYLGALALLFELAALLTNHERMILAAAKVPLLGLIVAAGIFFPAYFLFIVVLLIATRLYYFKRFGIVYPSLA